MIPFEIANLEDTLFCMNYNNNWVLIWNSSNAMTNYGVINKIKIYISTEVQVVLLSMKQ